MSKVLVLEDERSVRASISRVLKRGGHQVVETETIGAAASAVDQGDFDIILTDVNLPDGDGIDFVRKLRGDGFDGAVVVLTAFGSVENAVRAMKEGANDFLQKQMKFEELPLQVEKWIEQSRMARRLSLFERLEKTRDDTRAAIGASKAWLETIRLSERLAAMPLPDDDSEGGALPAVLLLGETGAGKGVLAKVIHDCATQHALSSGRAAPPFVHVNCSALPATLVESELFGHERGAFTDARTARPGLFEMADGGTIFLDEISEMPLELQSKLLIAVEQGRFRRIGGAKDRTVRVRVIAASNLDLKARAEEGKFRRDLFYRLNALTIQIPPLRQREGDAVLIAESALKGLAKRYGRPQLVLSDAARAAIAAYDWPGNVRELMNCMQRVAMLCDKEVVEVADLGIDAPPVQAIGAVKSPDEMAMRHQGPREDSALPVFDLTSGITADDVEKALLLQALRHAQGNVSQAARLIGLTRASMRYRMERYGLQIVGDAAGGAAPVGVQGCADMQAAGRGVA